MSIRSYIALTGTAYTYDHAANATHDRGQQQTRAGRLSGKEKPDDLLNVGRTPQTGIITEVRVLQQRKPIANDITNGRLSRRQRTTGSNHPTHTQNTDDSSNTVCISVEDSTHSRTQISMYLISYRQHSLLTTEHTGTESPSRPTISRSGHTDNETTHTICNLLRQAIPTL